MDQIVNQLKLCLVWLLAVLGQLGLALINILNDDRFIGAMAGLGTVATTTSICVLAFRQIKHGR